VYGKPAMPEKPGLVGISFVFVIRVTCKHYCATDCEHSLYTVELKILVPQLL